MSEIPSQETKSDTQKTDIVKTDIALDHGLMVPKTATELWRTADLMLKSGSLPQQYKTVPQVIVGMQILRQLNLPDVACLRLLAIINGSFNLWGDAPKGLAMRSGQVEDFDEWWFDPDYNRISIENKNLKAPIFGAACLLRRVKVKTDTVRSFTVDDATQAGLWGKSGPWKTYTKRMLQLRARSWALKDMFPDMLLGIGIAEYDHNVLVQENGNELVQGENTAQSVADDLNSKYLEEAG